MQSNNSSSVSATISGRLQWIFNYQHHYLGRIWVGWDPVFWSVKLLFSSAQMITCDILRNNSTEHFVASFVYAFNDYIDRRVLWSEISQVKTAVTGLPWCILGDFNVITHPDESVGGVFHWHTCNTDFVDCIHSNHLLDLRYYGQYHTWWNSFPDNPTFRKLDRVLVDDRWFSSYPLSSAKFLPRGLSDHSPATVSLGRQWDCIRKPFKFFNHFIEHPKFLEEVRNAWDSNVTGSAWFILTAKLK